MSRSIRIFDSTLSLGALYPGFSMSAEEKLEIARQLEAMKIDIIELGFPIADLQEFESVNYVARQIKGATCAANARTLSKDIERAAQALKGAVDPLIHIFMTTSALNMKQKLRMNEDAVLERAVSSVKQAKAFCRSVEFTCDDAFEADKSFLIKLSQQLIEAGVSTINYSDTKGFAVPENFSDILTDIKQNVPGTEHIALSVHAKNDLGLAAANTLAAIKAGADQIKTTVLGIGNRSGNAALEEIIMALTLHKNVYGVDFNAESNKIYRITRVVSSLSGAKIGHRKPIVGDNIFTPESFETQSDSTKLKPIAVLTPQSIGMNANNLPLGKATNIQAFIERLRHLGYNMAQEEYKWYFDAFKALTRKKQNVLDKDIEALMEDKQVSIPEVYTLDRYIITCTNTMITSAAVTMITEDGSEATEISMAQGPVDAAYLAISKIVGERFSLHDYQLRSITEGQDAQGEVSVKIRRGEKHYSGRGLSTDVIEASIKAYLNAINKMFYDLKKRRVEQ